MYHCDIHSFCVTSQCINMASRCIDVTIQWHDVQIYRIETSGCQYIQSIGCSFQSLCTEFVYKLTTISFIREQWFDNPSWILWGKVLSSKHRFLELLTYTPGILHSAHTSTHLSWYAFPLRYRRSVQAGQEGLLLTDAHESRCSSTTVPPVLDEWRLCG